MNKKQILKVRFQDCELLAVRIDSGELHIPTSHACDSIGLNRAQKQKHLRKTRDDIVLNRGSKIIKLSTHQKKSVLLECIEISLFPLWLAKIFISPKMKREYPVLASDMIQFQLKVADILRGEALEESIHILPVSYQEALEEPSSNNL